MNCPRVMNLLLNLVFQLKFLRVLMGRKGPEEFSIWSACLLCLFVCLISVRFFLSGFCIL
jgi:hypothetical protein